MRRLPGIAFETVLPVPADVLPRMDVAGFVGFAASGPVDLPVAIEDPAQFAALFGADLDLAWDAVAGAVQRAYLGPAVRAFFQGGGRRCWVVRVARQPHVAQVPLAGLLRLDASGGVTPAFAPARSPGSWADALRVRTAQAVRPVEVAAADWTPAAGPVLTAWVPRERPVLPGDLLRVTIAGHLLMAPVAAVAEGSAIGAPRPGLRQVRLDLRLPTWWRRPTVPAAGMGLATAFSPSGSVMLGVATIGEAWSASAPLSVDVALSAPVPQPGEVLRLDLGGEVLWLTVAVLADRGGGVARIRGDGLAQRLAPVLAVGQLPDRAELVAGELLVQGAGGDAPAARLAVGLGAGHPRFLGDLPDDSALFAPLLPGATANRRDPLAGLRAAVAAPRFPLAGASGAAAFLPVGLGAAASPPLPPATSLPPATALERDGLASFDWRLFLDAGLATQPTGALAGAAEFALYRQEPPRALTGVHALWPIEEVTLVAVPDAVQSGWRRQADPVVVMPPPSPPLDHPEWRRRCHPRLEEHRTCDVLDLPLPALRLDGLAADGAPTLAWRALPGTAVLDELEDSAPAQPRTVYRGDAASVTLPARAAGIWFYRLRIEAAGHGSTWTPWLVVIVPPAQPPFDRFVRCGLRVLVRPVLTASAPTSGGAFAVGWTATPDASYVLDELVGSDPVDAVTIHTGDVNAFSVIGRRPGTYFYRVRVVLGASAGTVPPDPAPSGCLQTSDWSDWLAVTVTAVAGWEVLPEGDVVDSDLLAVQRALVRLGAARGDVFAVLALPAHYRADDAVEHLGRLRGAISAPADVVPALTVAEAAGLCHAGCWHPWQILRDAGGGLRALPPDGLAAGHCARRALERGVWVAPANLPLTDVVALTPAIPSERWQALQDAQLNVVRDDPRGVLTLSADTLSSDLDLRAITTRRLLSLLRRLAQRHGATWVFEPLDAALRRRAQRTFESVLGLLFQRGAFAGRNEASSFQVVVDEAPETAERGRLIIELRVAPALPLRFITVRLVQLGDRSVVVEGR